MVGFLPIVLVSAAFSAFSGAAGDDRQSQGKWQPYLKRIKAAVEAYKECSNKNSGCYQHVLEEDLAPWQERGGITRKDFEAAKTSTTGVHYQIVDHKLYRQEDCLFGARCEGVEHFLLELVDKLPDMEMMINMHDHPQAATWGRPLPLMSFSKSSNEMDILFPAWTFWGGGPAVWPLYPTGLGRWDQQRVIINESANNWPWEKKKNVAFFRGSRTSSERDPLILYSRKHPDLVDAAYTKNQAWKSDKDTLGQPAAKEIKLEDHCKYKYLFNFRGVAASFRFKHLFVCRSLVYHVGEDWVEFFYSALKPWVHYIPIDTEMNNLEELIAFARENDEIAKEIAERGHRFIMDHLRQVDVKKYWKLLLKRYAKLLKWTVKRNNALKLVTA